MQGTDKKPTWETVCCTLRQSGLKLLRGVADKDEWSLQARCSKFEIHRTRPECPYMNDLAAEMRNYREPALATREGHTI